LATSEKRAQKETREGVIASFVTPCRRKALLLEVNCETDFVAKSDLFLKFVNGLGSSFLHKEEPINVVEEAEQAKATFT
jgi:elongation factor Ts